VLQSGAAGLGDPLATSQRVCPVSAKPPCCFVPAAFVLPLSCPSGQPYGVEQLSQFVQYLPG